MSDENPRNVLVRSANWQRIRTALLGQWSKRPEWCCAQLKKYLGPLLQVAPASTAAPCMARRPTSPTRCTF